MIMENETYNFMSKEMRSGLLLNTLIKTNNVNFTIIQNKN